MKLYYCYYFFIHRKRAVIALTIHNTLQRRKKNMPMLVFATTTTTSPAVASIVRRRVRGRKSETERERVSPVYWFFHLVNLQELIWRGVVVAHARTRSLSRLARYGWLAIIFLCFYITLFLALVLSPLVSRTSAGGPAFPRIGRTWPKRMRRLPTLLVRTHVLFSTKISQQFVVWRAI